jgi:uncharacterized protein (TIGR03066 family)
MKKKQLLVSAALCLSLSAALAAPEKSSGPSKSSGSGSGSKSSGSSKDAVSKDKLIGAWEITEDSVLGAKGTGLEFTKDNKVIISEKKRKGSGTYTLDGKTLKWKLGAGGISVETPPMTIVKLTDKDLVIEDVAGQKTPLTRK